MATVTDVTDSQGKLRLNDIAQAGSPSELHGLRKEGSMPLIENRPTLSLEKVMYAADFSPISDCAGRYAKGLAQRFGSKVQIAHVFPCYEDLTSDAVKADQRVRRQQLIERQHEFSAAGIETQNVNSSEYPVPSALLLIETQFRPDMIIIGTHSKSTFDRLL